MGVDAGAAVVGTSAASSAVSHSRRRGSSTAPRELNSNDAGEESFNSSLALPAPAAAAAAGAAEGDAGGGADAGSRVSGAVRGVAPDSDAVDARAGESYPALTRNVIVVTSRLRSSSSSSPAAAAALDAVDSSSQ